MTPNEIIREVKALQIDCTNEKITIPEAIEALENFAIEVKKDFSDLYNAFYSSNPSLYIF